MGRRRVTGKRWPDGLGHPWPVGTRVRLREDGNAPSLSGRTGVITEHRPINGGYMVLHEEGSVSLNNPEAKARGPFGWSYHELELVDPNAINETDEDDWFDWPLH